MHERDIARPFEPERYATDIYIYISPMCTIVSGLLRFSGTDSVCIVDDAARANDRRFRDA